MYYSTFYVTFGDILINYHLIVTARNEDIVRAFMQRRSGIRCYSRILATQPTDTKPLNEKPLELCYADAGHI